MKYEVPFFTSSYKNILSKFLQNFYNIFILSFLDKVTEVNIMLKSNSNLHGICFILLSVFFFAGVDTCSKLIHSYAPVIFTNLIRYILLISCLCVLLVKQEKREELLEVNKSSLFFLLLRGAFQGGTGVFYLLAVQTMPLSITSAFYFTAPIFVVALSPYLLKEEVHFKQWICVLCAFIGAIIIVRPAIELSPIGLMWISFGMVSLVFLFILTRKLSSKVKNWQQMFYGNVGALITAILALPLLDSLPTSLEPTYFLIFACMISFTLLGQFFMIKAFSSAPASTLAPFTYLQLVFVLIISHLFLSEQMDFLSLCGIATILLAGVFASRK